MGRMGGMLAAVSCILLAASTGGWTLDFADIPACVSHDAVMANERDVRETLSWVAAAFAGEKPLPRMSAYPPFSFTYGAAEVGPALKDWDRAVEKAEKPDRVEYAVSWRDPKTGLKVTTVVGAFREYAAVDWVLYFENTGGSDTPILEKINALDIKLPTDDPRLPVVLHRLHGDACGEKSFEPYDTPLNAGDTISMAPTGGRSSSTTAFPFFNYEYNGTGMIVAVGWSGQWAAKLERARQGPTRITAGMELTHLVLHPGEKIRTPRIVIMSWMGDRLKAHNSWRRLMLYSYAPKIDGKPVRLPIALQTFDRYIGKEGWATESGQIDAAKAAANLGCDTYWFDAGWFEGGFPRGVGNWFCKPNQFPNGLKPLGDAVHKLGMKFVLWFEPERVAKDTLINREHSGWTIKLNDNDSLFNLADSEARRWLTDLLHSRINEFGVDVYRNDFNMDPLPCWRSADAPDRQGMTEIRYVEGLYEMWDELRSKHPGLWIDNCASGGRRIDIEMCMRSVPLWRSDTCCRPGHPEWNQMQNCAISAYIPLFTAAGWSPEPNEARSAATGGALVQWGYMEPNFPTRLAKQTITEIKKLQKYWYGDIYPLSPITVGLDKMMAYQLHRSDLDEGVVLAFRRENCPYISLQVSLKALKPGGNYEVQFIDNKRKVVRKTMTAEQLQNLELQIPEKDASLIVMYSLARQ